MALPANLQAAHDAAQELFETLREIYEIGSVAATQRYMQEPDGAAWVIGGKKGPPPLSWHAALVKFSKNHQAWREAIEQVIPRLSRADPTKPLEGCVAATHCGTLLEVAAQLRNRAEFYANQGEASFLGREFFKGGDLSITVVDVGKNWLEFLAGNMAQVPYDHLEWKQHWLAIETEFCQAAAPCGDDGEDWRQWPIYSPKQLRIDLGLSATSIAKQLASGEIRNHRMTSKRYHIHPVDLARGHMTKAMREKSRTRSQS